MRISRDTMEEWQSGANGTRLSQLIPTRDYSGLNFQTEQLRLWMPEPAKQALTELSERSGKSMTVYLTEYFAVYIYGYHEVLRMRESRTGLYQPLLTKFNAQQVQAEPEPNLGKNIFALKIFVPGKLKQELQKWADRAGVSLGHFARLLVCSHLFGREYGPNELIVLSAEEARLADEWERASGDM